MRLFPGDGLHRPGIQFAQATSDLDTPLSLGVFINLCLKAFDQMTGNGRSGFRRKPQSVSKDLLRLSRHERMLARVKNSGQVVACRLVRTSLNHRELAEILAEGYKYSFFGVCSRQEGIVTGSSSQSPAHITSWPMPMRAGFEPPQTHASRRSFT